MTALVSAQTALAAIFGTLAVVWLVLAPVLRMALLAQAHPIYQRVSEFPRVLRWPVTVLLVAVAANLALPEVPIPGDEPGMLDVAARQGTILGLVLTRLAIGVSLWFCLRPVIRLVQSEFIERRLVAYGKSRQRNTANVVFRLTVPAAFLLVVAFTAWLFNLNVTAALVAAGTFGAAVAVALQHVLANVFAGVSLALDTHFARNDLIRIEDGTLYQVINRGLRATTVRNIESHEIAYVPNQTLLSQTITDVTQPSDDMRAVIRLSVPRRSDLRKVRGILSDIANGHPHVIGGFANKEKSIHQKIYRLYIRNEFAECKQHFIELARLEAEKGLNEQISRFAAKLENWAQFVDQAEERGFDAAERKWLAKIADELDADASEIRRRTTEWMILFRNCVAKGRDIRFRFPQVSPPDGSGKIDDGATLSKADLGRGGTSWRENSFADHKLVAPGAPELEPEVEYFFKLIRRCIRSKSNDMDWWDSQFGNKKPQNFVYELGELADRQEFERELEISGGEFQSDRKGLTGRIGKKLRWLSMTLSKLSDPANKSWAFSPELEDQRDRRLGYVRTPADLKDYASVPLDSEDLYAWVCRSSFQLEKTFSAGEKNWKFEPTSTTSAIEAVHNAIAAANFLSRLAKISPETHELREVYYVNRDSVERIRSTYNELGGVYRRMLRDIAEWIARSEYDDVHPELRRTQAEEVTRATPGESEVGGGVSIALCRTRTEDLHISRMASEHLMDHPLLEAAAGRISDDDERSDLSEVFREWADKADQLIQYQRRIGGLVRQAQSTTIDTELREFARWLKEGFKDPFPLWKYPLAPVEGYSEYGVDMTMKIYIDNVRMEKYLRPFNTFTQLRLRIHERLGNEGIQLPYPHRIMVSPDEAQGSAISQDQTSQTAGGKDGSPDASGDD